MADKDESTSNAVTIDTNPGNLFAHLPLSEPQILSTAKTWLFSDTLLSYK